MDGFIARNWDNQKSVLGSALDPLADKILISVLYVSLTYADLIPGKKRAVFQTTGVTEGFFFLTLWCLDDLNLSSSVKHVVVVTPLHFVLQAMLSHGSLL